MKRSKGFTLIELLVVISIIALLIGILLPALGAARRAARQMKNTTQVRGIVQGLVVYAGGNKERMPGTDSKGFLIPDSEMDGNETFLDSSGIHGGTVAGRYFLMLDNNQFTGEYLISPSETKTVWTTNQTKDISTNNYSFALLNIHQGNAPTVAVPIRPDQSGRAREWKQSINTQAVLISDRARMPSTASSTNGDHDVLYSIHTSEDDEKWAGSVGRGDGSASFENESALDTKYGSGTNIEADRLFAEEKSNDTTLDVVPNNINWSNTMLPNNALLGYSGLGSEEGSTTNIDAVASN